MAVIKKHDVSAAHLVWMLSFFVDGLLENTQLSKLLCTKRAREPNDGWHNGTFFQDAEGVALFHRLKYLAFGVLLLREKALPDSPFPLHSS